MEFNFAVSKESFIMWSMYEPVCNTNYMTPSES